MKNTKVFFVFLVILALVQGCIPSLYPLYTRDKLVKVPELEGVWTDREGDKVIRKKEKVFGEEKETTITIYNDDGSQNTVWDFRKKEDGQYFLIHVDEKGHVAGFDIHIVRLGDDLYMDFYPEDIPGRKLEPGGIDEKYEPNNLLAFHLLPVHTFAKLTVTNERLSIKMFDPDFLEKLLTRRQIRIRHEALTDGGYLLTAQPEELQQFVEKYGDENDAYINDVIDLRRADDQ